MATAKQTLKQCTICQSLYADEVNEKLANGVTQSKIVAFLSGKGIELSTMSVSRHNRNCRLHQKKPQQIQKGNIRAATQKANGGLSQKLSDPDAALGKIVDQTIDPPPAGGNKNRGRKTDNNLKGHEKILKQLKDDFDIYNEYLYVLAVAKDRVERGRIEEETSQLVLATTGRANADYGALLKNFHEITQGMESLESLRMAELVYMIGDIFSKAPLTDQARHQFLTLMKDQEVFVKRLPEDTDPQGEIDIEIIEDPPMTMLPADIKKRKAKARNAEQT